MQEEFGPEMRSRHFRGLRDQAVSSALCHAIARSAWRGRQVHDGAVLRDADRSLANWLMRLLPQGVGLRFEAPSAQWATDPPEALFVNAFLYSIRHDGRGRQSGWSDVRDGQGHVIGRQSAAQYYRLAYLVTVWSAGQGRDRDGGDRDGGDRVMAEHEVLGAVLDGCAHCGVLPEDCLDGALAQSGLRTVLDCAPADSPQVPGELWAGLGIAPRAHLDLIVLAPAKPPVESDLAPPAREIVLNAGQERISVPAEAVSATQERQPEFGTRRHWEKRTINEPPYAPGTDRGPG